MRIGFLLKRGKPEARELAIELGEVLRRRSCPIVVVEEDAGKIPGATVVAAAALGRSVDAVVVLGGDGTFLNAELVANGYADIMSIRPNVAHAEELRALVRRARSEKLGLWGACR